jgi:exosortase N
LTGSILQHIGYHVSVHGNVFWLNGREFSVDPACAGLKMLAVSLLIGLFFMAYFERQKGRKFSFLTALIVLTIVIMLNVLSNLTRILILAIFTILPGNPLHDMVGMICLILYVIIPSYYIIQLASKKFIRNHAHEKTGLFHFKTNYINLLLTIIIWITGISLTKKEPAGTSLPALPLQGYAKEIVKEDIVKLEKPDILLYIKPLKRFYGAEHNPMICWTGSGYSFTHIQKVKVGEKEIFTGILKKENEIVYASWWFDSGKSQTTKQINWRWRALKGENFYLINVNSWSKEKLEEEVKRLLEGR